MATILHEVDDEAVEGWARHFEKNLDGKTDNFRMVNKLPENIRLSAQRRLVRGTLETLLPSQKYSVHQFDHLHIKNTPAEPEETSLQADDRALRRTKEQIGNVSEDTWRKNAEAAGKDVDTFRNETWAKVYESNRRHS